MPAPGQCTIGDVSEGAMKKSAKIVDICNLHEEKGAVIIEGKTKIVYELPNHPGKCLVKSKVRKLSMCFS